MEAVFVFPHHLYRKHPGFDKNRLVCFLEDPLFFEDKVYPLKFHKQKIAFHRATMKAFEKQLNSEGQKTVYFNFAALNKDPLLLSKKLKELNVTTIHVVEFDDYILEKRIKSLCSNLQIKLVIHQTLGFLTKKSSFIQLYKGKSHYSFQSFYIHQRKELGLLLDENGKPLGSKWTFDTENRKKFPKTLEIPPLTTIPNCPIIEEAIRYTKNEFPANPGELNQFYYPISHKAAKESLRTFLSHKIAYFGDFQDAIVKEESFLFHSLLSPSLNVGLLTPGEVISETLEFSEDQKIPLNALEGFIRQIIGWREFIRGIYHCKGSYQRQSNFFNHERKLTEKFYTANTGVLPFDNCIKKLHKTAYLHHIERLMLAGNFFLLCEIEPTQVYKWFMELFIDSYDWVMVPNVYGMSQYADGGLMTTKPYVCGSNYILKMSNYEKGEWSTIWDALFWRFINKNILFFERQPRLKMLAKIAQSKKSDKTLTKTAEQFLENL